jgi:predicted PurR-regulated permease PerM
MQGILEGIGLFVFGVPNPVLLGTITVIGALVPMLGTVIVTVPATIYLIATGHIVAATGFLLWGLLIVGLVDNFVRPKVLERETKLHPLLLLLSVLGGINFFGALGFILGPILLSLLFTLLEMYKKDFKKYISKS